MRKFLVLAGAVFVLMGAGVSYLLLADAKVASKHREVIDCDLGDLPPGTTVERTVRLPNDTKDVLTIRSITKDCTCVVEELSRQFIPPNGYIELLVKYSTPSAPGPVRHVLEVTYHEASIPTAILIHGTVSGWAEVAPAEVDFSDVWQGKEVQREVIVRARQAWPRSERTAQLLLEHGKIIGEESQLEGRHVKYRLAFAPPPAAESKKYRGELVIRWLGREDRRLKIPCVGRAVSQWYADPDQAFFGITRRGTTRQIDLRIHDRCLGGPATLSGVGVTHDLGSLFEVRSSTTGDNALTVSVSIKPGEATATGFANGRIDVLGPDRRIRVSIPVRALVE